MSSHVFDVIGIGFGPANLALAVALEESGFSGSIRFLEKRNTFSWQPGMLLRGSDIQHNPLRDLITPVNPRSAYGFVNYMHGTGRFFEYLNLGAAFPLRREFASYVKWVANQFSHQVAFGTEVTGMKLRTMPDGSEVVVVECGDGACHLARSVVVGPGRSANVPEIYRPHIGARVFHLVDYLPKIKALPDPAHVIVVGASQSAVEIMLDLDARFPRAEITGLMRSFGYRQKDTSPWTGEVYFPEFTQYYHDTGWKSRRALSEELRGTNYSSADADVINQLYLRRYESRLEGADHHINMVANAEANQVEASRDGVRIACTDRHSGAPIQLRADAVVLATGFLDFGTGGQRELVHPLLETFCLDYAFHTQHGFEVARDYSLIGEGHPPVYLNGLCESTHGFGDAGSFSLLSLRADEICRSLAGRLASSGMEAGITDNLRLEQSVTSMLSREPLSA